MYNLVLPAIGLVAFALSLFDFLISKSEVESKKIPSPLLKNMKKIAKLIKTGGFSCLNAQYAPCCVVLILLYALFKFVLAKNHLALGLVVGFVSCISCVYYCFTVAMSANIRTAISALDSLKSGFVSSYRFGRSVGLFVLSASILVISAFFFYPANNRFEFMLGVAMGVSSVSLFARLAGGIFTKGADIGADLVGKVIKDLPEDDPRNPGTIADNIGDNIGDCVGTAADIHETYILAFMAIAYFSNFALVIVPALAATLGSILGVYLVRSSGIKNSEKEVFSAMSSMIISSLAASIVAFFALNIFFNHMDSKPIFTIGLKLLVPFLIGLLYIPAIFMIINYYTSKSSGPVKFLAESCKDGAAMNIIGGYAISLQSAFITIVLAASVGLATYSLCGIEGLLITISTVLGFVTSIMTMDTYGPITDNAGGIVSMAGAPESARENTDALDSIGNLTKALTKGYSSGVTILTAFLLLKLLFSKSSAICPAIEAANPMFIFAIFLGASVPFVFSGLVIESVHKAANYMLKAIQKIIETMNENDKNYYTYPIRSLSKQSVRAMLVPTLSIFAPILVGVVIHFISNNFTLTFDKSFFTLLICGTVVGISSTGLLLSVCMTIGGATWDNTKKLVEELFGQKIKTLRREMEDLIKKPTETGKPKTISIDSLQMIYDSLQDLVKLKVSEDDKGSVFDTFKQAVTNQTVSLKDWINQNKTLTNPVSPEKINLKACLDAIKNGLTEPTKSVHEQVFALHGELEKFKAIKDAAVTGDMLGDPLKDAAGTGLNSMVKMSLVLSLVAIGVFCG